MVRARLCLAGFFAFIPILLTSRGRHACQHFAAQLVLGR